MATFHNEPEYIVDATKITKNVVVPENSDFDVTDSNNVIPVVDFRALPESIEPIYADIYTELGTTVIDSVKISERL